MNVEVEFFGVPRQRAGVAQVTARGESLGDVLADLEQKMPGLAPDCIHQGRLQTGFTANLNGNQFVTDPDTPLTEGQVILILSADAGG